MKKQSLIFFKYSRGFSLIEMVTVVGLSSLLVSLSFGVLLQLKKDSFALTNAIEKQQSKSEFQIFLNVTFSRVQHSFNLVNQLDDNNKIFFDYTWDSPLLMISQTTAKREIIFSPTKLRELYFIESMDSIHPTITYDPVYAYKVTSLPNSPYESASFTYQGINSSISGTNFKVLSQKMSVWKKGQLFLLQSPIPIRRLTSTEIISNPQTPPRMLSFIGVVNADESDLVPISGIQDIIFNKHPAREPTATNAVITSADQFFRSLPTSGGAAPIVTLTPIQIVKLSPQVDSPDNSSIKIEKISYEGKIVSSGTSTLVESKKVLVKDKLKSLTLKRATTNLPLIEISFEEK